LSKAIVQGNQDGVSATNLSRATDLATSLEVASSLWAKFMGLMGRATLATGAGLWLPESNGIHMMFMRFPIDAVFVGKPESGGGADGDGDGDVRSVVSVHRSLRTWTGLVPLVRGAHGVLELPVGTIDASATQVGDRIRIG
jgi:uncharacterized membrane protein (UPF0127 family)